MSIGKNSIARATLSTDHAQKTEANKKREESALLLLQVDSIKHVKGYSKKPEYKAGKELVSSIKQNGIIQPILVAVTKEGKFYILDGVLRLDAAKMLKIKTVPAVAVAVENEPEARALYKSLKATLQKAQIKAQGDKVEKKETAVVKRAVKEVPYYLL